MAYSVNEKCLFIRGSCSAELQVLLSEAKMVKLWAEQKMKVRAAYIRLCSMCCCAEISWLGAAMADILGACEPPIDIDMPIELVGIDVTFDSPLGT